MSNSNSNIDSDNIIIIQHKANSLQILEKANSSHFVDIIEIDLVYSSSRNILVLAHDPDKANDIANISLFDLPDTNKPLMFDLKVDPQFHYVYMKCLMKYIEENADNKTIYVASFNHYFIDELYTRIKNKTNIKFGLIIHSCFPRMDTIIPPYISFVNMNNYNYIPIVREELARAKVDVFLYTVNNKQYLSCSKSNGIISDNPENLI